MICLYTQMNSWLFKFDKFTLWLKVPFFLLLCVCSTFRRVAKLYLIPLESRFNNRQTMSPYLFGISSKDIFAYNFHFVKIS